MERGEGEGGCVCWWGWSEVRGREGECADGGGVR